MNRTVTMRQPKRAVALNIRTITMTALLSAMAFMPGIPFLLSFRSARSLFSDSCLQLHFHVLCIHQAGNRFAVKDLLQERFQFFPCGKHPVPVKIRKTVNGKENV